jgi:hypothetical protein
MKFWHRPLQFYDLRIKGKPYIHIMKTLPIIFMLVLASLFAHAQKHFMEFMVGYNYQYPVNSIGNLHGGQLSLLYGYQPLKHFKLLSGFEFNSFQGFIFEPYTGKVVERITVKPYVYVNIPLLLRGMWGKKNKFLWDIAPYVSLNIYHSSYYEHSYWNPPMPYDTTGYGTYYSQKEVTKRPFFFSYGYRITN